MFASEFVVPNSRSDWVKLIVREIFALQKLEVSINYFCHYLGPFLYFLRILNKNRSS